MTLSIVLGLSNFHGGDRALATSMLEAIVGAGYCTLVREVVEGDVLEVEESRGAVVTRWLDPAHATARAILADTRGLSVSMGFDQVPPLASLLMQRLSLPAKRREKFQLDLPGQPELQGYWCSPVDLVGGWGRYKRAQQIYLVASQHSLIVHAE